jgi:hypothetical protein
MNQLKLCQEIERINEVLASIHAATNLAVARNRAYLGRTPAQLRREVDNILRDLRVHPTLAGAISKI